MKTLFEIAVVRGYGKQSDSELPQGLECFIKSWKSNSVCGRYFVQELREIEPKLIDSINSSMNADTEWVLILKELEQALKHCCDRYGDTIDYEELRDNIAIEILQGLIQRLKLTYL